MQDLKSLISGVFLKKPTHIEMGVLCGVNRNTISLIRRECPQAHHAQIFERIFNALNANLREDYSGKPCPFDIEKHCEEFQDVSGRSPQTPPASTSVTLNPEQQIADLLWELDCVAQKACFDERWVGCDRAAIISIRAKGIDTQKWLVKRFARKVPRFSTARPFPIEVRSHDMRWNFEAFWEELARPLEIAAEPEDVIQRLCDCYQTQSVVIALYGLDGGKRFAKERQQVMEEFWQPLYEKVCALPRSPSSRLVLFLTGEVAQSDDVAENLTDEPLSSVYSLRLPDLATISQRDVELWLTQDDVYNALCGLRQNLDFDTLLRDDLPNWTDYPGEVFQEIRSLFDNLDFNLDLRSHWELAG